MDIVEKVREMIEPVIVDNSYILDSVLYEKEGTLYFLRVIIDKIGGVNIEDCVNVSRLINPILDKEDPISEGYILDVCSKESGD